MAFGIKPLFGADGVFGIEFGGHADDGAPWAEDFGEHRFHFIGVVIFDAFAEFHLAGSESELGVIF